MSGIGSEQEGSAGSITLTRRRLLRGGAVLAGLAATGGLLRVCVDTANTGRQRAEAGVMTIGEYAQTFVLNFNPFSDHARWATVHAMYEPLMIYDFATQRLVPWLATSYEWSKDNKTLFLHVRSDVRWSDGRRFTARDAEFTFDLMRSNPGLRGWAANAWGSYLASVKATDRGTVAFTFDAAYTPGLYELVSQFVVPAHVWRQVKDPLTFTNPNPVATGPFTEIEFFRNQVYQLGKNPQYWQKGKPYVRGLNFSAYVLISSQTDWGIGSFSDIQNGLVDKGDRHYWGPALTDLYVLLDLTRRPFDDVRVRRAVSMALDRERMAATSTDKNTRVANAVGLPVFAYRGWISQRAVRAGEVWISHDPQKANQMLDGVGLRRGSDGIRRTPDGTPMQYRVTVPKTATDWVDIGGILAENLRDVGIGVTMKEALPRDWTSEVISGRFDITIVEGTPGATPFQLYRSLMSSKVREPVEPQFSGNQARYENPRADALLDRFATTSEMQEQRRICDRLQMLFVESVPALPVCDRPRWEGYSSRKFTDFPGPSNPYAPPSRFPVYPTTFIVLTTVKPR